MLVDQYLTIACFLLSVETLFRLLCLIQIESELKMPVVAVAVFVEAEEESYL